MREALDEIWARYTDAEGEPTEDSWATRMEAHEKQQRINPLDKISKPDLGKLDWGIRLEEGGLWKRAT